MPITTYPPTHAFTLYYKFVGNNNNTNPTTYRPSNPWQTARSFCKNLATSHSDLVETVSMYDDSVFQIRVQAVAIATHHTIDVVARMLLDELAIAVAPMIPGDKLVAVVPDGGRVQEIHHTP